MFKNHVKIGHAHVGFATSPTWAIFDFDELAIVFKRNRTVEIYLNDESNEYQDIYMVNLVSRVKEFTPLTISFEDGVKIISAAIAFKERCLSAEYRHLYDLLEAAFPEQFAS